MNETIEKLSLIISRFFAFVIDLGLIIILAKILPVEGIISNRTFVEVIFFGILIFQIYFFLFEMLFKTTLGKIIFGLKIYFFHSNDDSPIKNYLRFAIAVLIRNFLRIVIFIPPLFFWNEILVLILQRGKSFSEFVTGIKVSFNKVV